MTVSARSQAAVHGVGAVPRDFGAPDGPRLQSRPAEVHFQQSQPDLRPAYLTAAVAAVLAEAYEQDGWTLEPADLRGGLADLRGGGSAGRSASAGPIALSVTVAGRTTRQLVDELEAQLLPTGDRAAPAEPSTSDRTGLILFEGNLRFEGNGAVPDSLDFYGKSSLVVALRVGPGPVEVRAYYPAGCYEPALVDELVGALADGLGRLAGDAESAVHTVLSGARPELPSAAELGQLRAARPAGVTARFVRLVRDSPDAPAIRYGGTDISYRQLDEAVSLLTERTTIGTGEADRVVIYSHSCPELIAVLLAVVRAGRSFTILSPNEPPRRLADIMAALGQPPLVLVAPGSPDRLDAVAGLARLATVLDPATISVIDTPLSNWPTTLPPGGPLAQPHPGAEESAATEDEFYTVFTSGSTGIPKGISLTERAFTQFNEEFIQQVGLSAGDSMPLWATPSYDASYYEIFGTLLSGATLLIPLPADRASEAAALRWLAEQRPTHFQIVPSALRRLLETRRSANDVSSLASLRWLLCTGEHVSHEVLELVTSAGTSARFLNMYGPTECILTTWAELTAAELDRYRLPAGQAIGGRFVFVADHDGRPKQPGFIGEIVIVSEHLAGGYLGQDRLAAPFFRYSDSDTLVGFRTGDLGRLRPDGQLEVLGRIAAMVKRNGVRIEPGEIESRLRGLAEVESCIVLNVAAGTGARLVAFVLAGPDQQLSERWIRAQLPDLLPPQLYPDEIVISAEFPKLRNGKLDRQRLLDSAVNRPESIDEAAPVDRAVPATEAERIVIQAYERVLAVSGVTADGHFFGLGGHSLAAAEVVDSIFRVTGVRLEMSAVFAAPVVRELAALVDKDGSATPEPPGLTNTSTTAEDSAAAEDSATEDSVQVDEELPLAITQLPIWTSHQLAPQSSRHSVSMAFQLDRAPDWERLRAAVQHVVDQQPALRASFRISAGSVRQLVSAPRPVEFERPDSGSRELSLTEAAELVRQLGERPFVIEQGQLLRLLAVPCVAGRWVIALSTHHLVCDEESLHVMAGGIEQFYNDAAGRSAESPEAGYRQFAREASAERDPAETTRFWQGLMTEARVPEQPRTLPPGDGVLRPVTTDFEVSADQVARLRATAASVNATLSMLLLAVVAQVTGRQLAQPVVMAELAVSLREGPQHRDVVGCFANTMALPCPVEPDAEVGTGLAWVRQTVLAAVAHRYVDYAKLRRYAGGWCADGSSLADVVVAVHQKRGAHPALAGLVVSPFDHHAPYLRSPLATYWRPTAEGGLRCEVEADRTSYPDSRLAGWIADLRAGLAGLRLDRPLPAGGLADVDTEAGDTEAGDTEAVDTELVASGGRTP
ncbi:MAG: AMP-binding protein [Actinomycetota bacterium]|nr:AMP-binding protein [Actinomycetota bacterium]MDQ2956655.1 AMP-binding protein [Actinomycetota bacterium]